MCLRVASTSITMRLSTEIKKGGNCRHFWRQVSRYLFFFSFSMVWRHFSCDLVRWERELVFMTRMLWIISAPICQRLRSSRSPFCYDVLLVTGGLLWSDPIGWGFTSYNAWPGWMRGLLHTHEGVKDLPERSETPSQILLWIFVLRPPFL